MDDERTAGLVRPATVYQILGPGVRGGIEVQDDIVLDATENFHWLKSWPFVKARAFILARGWKLHNEGIAWR